MAKRKPTNPLDLTDQEAEVLQGVDVPAEVKAFAEQAHDVGDRIAAYSKVAALARAERLALREVRLLTMEHESVVSDSAYRQRIAALEGQKNDALALASRTQQELRKATALPAMAVHSND